MTEAIEEAAGQIMGEFEGMKVPEKVRVGELRVLAQIRRIPIREMVERLSRGRAAR